jgi:uncharacterized membrane protein
MSDRPVFIYSATYADQDDAVADYEVLLELHHDKLVGTYDVALITKDADGKIHVEKHEKATQHGAWGGIAVGALVGVLFPPSIIASATIGGVVGGVGGHLRKGMSRDDMKELGELLDGGQAATRRDRRVARRRATRQGTDTCPEVHREGGRRRQRGVQARARRGREAVRHDVAGSAPDRSRPRGGQRRNPPGRRCIGPRSRSRGPGERGSVNLRFVARVPEQRGIRAIALTVPGHVRGRGWPRSRATRAR